MSTSFIELREDQICLYSLGRDGRLATAASVRESVSEGYSFSLRAPEGADEAYLSLPVSILNFRVLEMPFQDMKKVRELVPLEVEGLILEGPEEVVFDVCPVGASRKVLVAFVSRSRLRTVLNRLKSGGLDPRSVFSVELAHILNSASSEDELMKMLLAPPPMSEEDRLLVAEKEIRSPTLDFRRGEFSYTKDADKTRRSLMVTAVLAVMVLLVFLIDMGLTVISTGRANRSMKEQIRKSYVTLFPAEKKIANELLQLKSHLKEMKEREEAYVGVSPLGFLRDLTRISRPGVSLTEVTMDRNMVVLKGECASLSEAQRIKGELEGFMDKVTISDTKPSTQNRTLFTITAAERKR